MVEVNGAHKHGRYEKNMVEHFAIISDVKSFRHARWPASQLNMTQYLDPDDTHMNQILVYISICTHTAGKVKLFFYSTSYNNQLLPFIANWSFQKGRKMLRLICPYTIKFHANQFTVMAWQTVSKTNSCSYFITQIHPLFIWTKTSP